MELFYIRVELFYTILHIFEPHLDGILLLINVLNIRVHLGARIERLLCTLIL